MVQALKWQLSRRLRNSQQGQSILLLAFGFIALAAFVGLVTDVSIMFIRYAALRQAVDSAAIAAAGQIREGTDYGTVALTARQYIRLHGLNPTRVWVETCETDIIEWKERTGGTQPVIIDANGNPVGVMPETELCDWQDPRKLVRVRAQIDSETTFLRLIGIDDFILTAAATSETAVLDVALVLDTSMSMADATDLGDYQAVGLSLPTGLADTANLLSPANDPVLDNPGSYNSAALNIRYGCIREEVGSRFYRDKTRLQAGSCCNDPGSNTALALQNDGSWAIYTDSNGNEQMDTGEQGIKNVSADQNFSDLICDPFKQVKDAARNFILRLDFVRGDRVALVTFDYWGKIIYPNNDTDHPPMMVSETDAINTLDQYVGVASKSGQSHEGCLVEDIAVDAAATYLTQVMTGAEQLQELDDRSLPRYWAYETIAPCGNTNIGDGILQANNVLTNAATIRRDAVWVAILLTDGGANSSLPAISRIDAQGGTAFTYGQAGFCPWASFCVPNGDRAPALDPNNVNEVGRIVECADGQTVGCEYANKYAAPVGTINIPLYQECVNIMGQPDLPPGVLDSNDLVCNDNNPNSRHFCLEWSNNPERNGKPPANFANDANCGVTSRYDADDYARDMADFSGLIEVAPGVPGNFIAMFTIGFGEGVADSDTAAPLLRYIADAGDNGIIDNNVQQDWREHRTYLRYGEDGSLGGGWPNSYGDNDPCYGVTDPNEWCGQYFFARTLSDLEAVFEAIASRLFTRISR